MRTDRRTFLAITTAGVTTAATGIRAGRAQGKPVRIGYTLSATGPYSVGAGITQAPNYALWADQVNAKGGLAIKGRGPPPRRVRHHRRPQRDRDGRALLREAHGRRQGGPDPAALGDGHELRGGADRQQVRLPDDRPHRLVQQAEGAVAALFLRHPSAAGLADAGHGGVAGGAQGAGQGLEARARVRERPVRDRDAGERRRRAQERRPERRPRRRTTRSA